MFFDFKKKKRKEDNKIQELEQTIQELTKEIHELKSIVANEEKKPSSQKEVTEYTAKREVHNTIQSTVTPVTSSTPAKENNKISLPDSLASRVPADSLINITSCGDKEKTYIEYKVKRDANLVFAKSFHPFIRKYTSNLGTCSQNILSALGHKPFRFEITQDALCVALEGGYYTCKYKETSDYITYEEWYQDSYHDGGGSGSKEWFLYPSSVEKVAENLLHDRYLGWCIIPECKGYWYEDEHLYLLDPWDIPGVFEYYHCVASKSDYDSDTVRKKLGVKVE